MEHPEGTSEALWQPPPLRLELKSGEAHAWRLRLDHGAPLTPECLATLSLEERNRADRFRFPADRSQFVRTHVILRNLLGRYTGLPPAQLHFHHNSFGKPALDSDCGGDWLRFNLSHSRNMTLIAVARQREVGVDLEWIRPDIDTVTLAKEFFSVGEIEMLSSVPPALRHKAFFACWTRKEAFLKASGTGLSMPLDQFAVSLDSRQKIERWAIQELQPDPNFAAALAIEGDLYKLECWQWTSGSP